MYCSPQADTTGKAVCQTCRPGYTLADDKSECYACNDASLTKCSICSHGFKCDECESKYHLFDNNRQCASKLYLLLVPQKNSYFTINNLDQQSNA